MKIQHPCVQSDGLSLCFTHFCSAESIIDCVESILKVGQGLPADKRVLTFVELLFHEHCLGLYIPRSYRFFFDMKIDDVREYLKVELDGLKFE